MKKQKQLHYILFRLFWDDEPVGFEYWSPEMKYSYTYGDPKRIDGYIGSGWCDTEIYHNRKEILDIKYVNKKYLKDKKEKDDHMKDLFEHIHQNKDIINKIRALNGVDPI